MGNNLMYKPTSIDIHKNQDLKLNSKYSRNEGMIEGNDNNKNIQDDSDDEQITGFPKLSNFGSALLTSEKENITKNKLTNTNLTLNDDKSLAYDNYSSTLSINRAGNVNTTSSMSKANNNYEYNNSSENISTGNSTFQRFKGLHESIKDELNTKNLERRKTRRFFNRTKMGVLGPAMRTNLENEKLGKNSKHETIEEKINKYDQPAHLISSSSTVASSSYTSYHDTHQSINQTSQTTINYDLIDFGELNPVQYIKKNNLPTTELPTISKLYFERQRAESRKIALKKHSSSKELLFSSSSSALKNSFNQISDAQNESKCISNNTGDTDALSEPKISDKENSRSTWSRNGYAILKDDYINNLEYYKNPSGYSSSLNKKREALSSINVNTNHNHSYQELGDNKRNKISTKGIESEIEHVAARNSMLEQQKVEQLNSANIHKHGKKKVEIIEPKSASANRIASKSVVSVNGVEYEKIELLGRGGSSKVYKVKNVHNNKIFALKRVMFDEFDESSIDSFKGEIELLKKLENEKRVVTLIQHQMESGVLLLIMECGDHDLSQILNQRMNMPLDIEFIRFHAREMLKCVKVVHDAGIVHSDLKPANFVFVKGILKIIDFGIANAVPDHTVNIYRETQIGTPNYMAPEALVAMNSQQDSDQQNKWKVGKPSDIWSCGCILYQMFYGRPPYGSFQGQNRLLAIMNPNVKIVFSEKTSNNERIPRSALETMKACLIRNPDKRWAVDQVLEGSFFNPVMVTSFIIRDLIKNAVNYGADQRYVTDEKITELADDVLNRLADFRL
ncbi:hypothetical protein Kpol_1032p10 [Vanderwaltozyma polyspora DSM 70294]|uniref:Protein kinase domain-containing protein n=1 Tax=Vanderwaltozyma polyspora (strain ATCC 22028 / DSM 70294 / BCRC 21397 / CBS 2163 / NBRC 10782 / NRRL Y-8283 / UCD 57-17) TaxID=436907 RepID=A7TGW6_VANPO|nr:uncharacterized protein Kpol_1032p10 [Vanderwaltozyma polyspora DSM 70294]EDO18418.1 hypothetical protein Kpol_1032p10 [Vanderwaltozyma polyspora DSM 70294]